MPWKCKFSPSNSNNVLHFALVVSDVVQNASLWDGNNFAFVEEECGLVDAPPSIVRCLLLLVAVSGRRRFPSTAVGLELSSRVLFFSTSTLRSLNS